LPKVYRAASILALLGLAASPVPATERTWLDRAAASVSVELRRSAARLMEIDSELAELPVPPGVPSGVSNGFCTAPALPGQEKPWLELTFPATTQIDMVALIPAVSVGSERPLGGYGFPRRFRVLCTAGDGTPKWQPLDHTRTEFPNPGIYPVTARFAPRTVTTVRIEVEESWQPDAPSVLALAELMVLSGNRNIAVAAPVQSSSTVANSIAWRRANLVDMSTPLGLPAVPDPSASMGWHSHVESSPQLAKNITIELPETLPLDELRLIPVDREGLPSWVTYGFPPQLKIEVAKLADFSDAQTMVAPSQHDLPSPGRNVIVYPMRGVTARHVRITATRLWHRAHDYLFALAEVQAYSGGRNVALGARTTASDTTDEAGWSAAALTDGHAYRQRLVELPEWLGLIERRHTLLTEQTALLKRRPGLTSRAQDRLVRIAAAAAGSLLALGGLAVWRQKRRSRREQERLREQLARDLHDDIGSNLGSIALLCDIVTRHSKTANPYLEDFAEIERIAGESADSMRDTIALLNPHPGSPNDDWVEVLQHLAERLLRGAELHFEHGGRTSRVSPNLELRRELYLFCKEALTNIARHAHATEIRFSITFANSGLDIELIDNGTGFDPATAGRGFGLPNLHRRAEQMRGTFQLQSQPGQGTTIHLHVPRQHGWHPR
jgi:signal transduction histidine kinase